MSAVTFEPATNQNQSQNALRVAATVVRLLEERGHVGPYTLNAADAEAVAEILNAEDGKIGAVQWDWQDVEFFLNGCRFVVKPDAPADVAALAQVAELRAELEQLRADLGLVHRYAVALEARLKQLEAGE